MDFDYQKLKEAESQQKEERLGSLQVHHPRPKPRPSLASEMTLLEKPPVKPRRSIKGRPTVQQGQLENQGQQENKVTVKGISPALILGPLATLEALVPSLRAHTLLWFERTQLPRLRTPGQSLPRWLHGFATRREAEQLLQDKPQGCFLLRLSESQIGFVLSYRGEDRCRHFIIEVEDSKTFGSVYLIAGENSCHQSLQDLINFYTHNPVGPFNEMLTVPCTQPNGEYEEIERLEMKYQEQGKENEISREDQTKRSIAAGLTALDPLPINPITSTKEESVQYAAVRKPLKKTLSLPECKCGTDTAPPAVENGSSELTERSSNLSVTEIQLSPVDAPYARVNKPPRATSENTPNDLQGATAAAVPPSLPSFDTTAVDQKYCKLEPMHTYEETLHTHSRAEEIDCYAVGWRRRVTRDAEEHSMHHVYSEVNIRGAQEGHAVSSRSSPNLPLRPPPRSAHAHSRAESSGQSFDLSPHMMVQPQHPSSRSIYEPISERPTSSRPSLPSPNPKR